MAEMADIVTGPRRQLVVDKDDLSDKKRPTIRDHLTWHLLIHKVRFQWLFEA